MRSNKNYCIISCGSNSQSRRGVYVHNDKFSFKLYIDGKNIIIDLGTYVYTPLSE